MKYAVNFPVVHDERSQIADANGVFTSPAIFILDYDNHIVQEFDEMPSRDEFMTLLKNKVEEYTKKKKLDMNVKSLIFLEKEKLNIERNNELKLNQEEDSSDPTLKSFNLFFPSGLAWNDEKEILAVADSSNHQIKIIDKYSKIIDVIGSGSPGRKDGNFRDASFRYPHNLVFDGTNLVLIDKGNDLLRLINLNEKIVQTIDARQYKGYSAIANFANGFILGTQNGLLLKSNREKIKKELDQFSSVTGLLYAKDIQKEKRIKSIFISDAKASSIYAIARNQVEKLDWNGANLVYPQGLAYDAGKIYVVDTYDNKIKIYDLIQNLVSTLEINIDNCQGDSCHSVFEPSSIVTANYGFEKTLFIADSARHRILKHSIDSNKTEVFYE
jgi:sugar lactone lactonase YvrE